MSYLITGSSGFIGSHLTKKIRETGDTVYSINRDLSLNLDGSGTFEELAENIKGFQDFIRAAEIKDRKSASTNPMLFYTSTFANLAQGSSKRTALKKHENSLDRSYEKYAEFHK